MTTADPQPPSGDTDTAALRDWFAGMALNGMLPAPARPGVLTPNMEGLAAIAYAHADAMLRARQLPPQPPKTR